MLAARVAFFVLHVLRCLCFHSQLILHACTNCRVLFDPEMWLNLNFTKRDGERERERWGGVVVNLCWSLLDTVWSAVNLPSLWPWHNLREKGTERRSVFKRLDIKVKDEIRPLTKIVRRTLGFLKTVSVEWLAAFSCLLMSWNQIVDTV